MMDLSQQERFDLDRLAEELGALPEAPLAMPVQQLEQPVFPALMALLRPRGVAQAKAGH